MATPESLVKALAEGLISGLLSTNEKPAKVKSTVVKTDDVQKAVREYVDQLMAQAEAPPQQEELFPTGGIDIGENILRRVEQARQRYEDAHDDSPPEGTFDPNSPNLSSWQSPIR